MIEVLLVEKVTSTEIIHSRQMFILETKTAVDGENKKTGRMGERFLHFNTSIFMIDAAKVDFEPVLWRIGFTIF